MNGFVDLMRTVPAPFNMVVYIVLIGGACGVLSSIVSQIGKFARHHQELQFKREMLDRGMTVGEVERVVRARREDV